MRLERVEIFGFKSFPHKVELQFDRGITAFVGPNGCGKTNVVEAVRWALGEQNAHVLRCDRMEDLIFNGTKSRKPLGIAEVTLTILNSGDLPVEFSEVAVCRRLYRSGESEYLINKTPCRLRDVLDLFMDTGLGHGAYSFFEQRMIDQILSSEPAARRAFFEEASGIARYRSRKRESLRRLEATEADLVRLDDIIGEVEQTVRSLRRQARKAQRYHTLKDELREAEIDLARIRVEELEKEAEELRERVSAQEQDRSRKGETLASLEKRLKEHRSWLGKEEDDSGTRGAELDSLTTCIQKLSERVLVSRERRRFLTGEENRLKDELKDLSSRIPGIEEEIKEARGEAEEVEKRAEEKRKRVGASVEGLKAAEEGVVGKRLRVEESEENLGEQAEKMDQLRREVVSLEVRLDTNRERKLSLEKDLAEVGSRREETRVHLTELKEGLEELNQSLKREETKGRSLGDRLESRKKKLDEVSQELVQLEGGLHHSKSELEILSSHQERLEGYSSAAKYLIEKEGVKVIDDLIDFPPEYQKAVEGVLSFKSQAAVVASGEDALRLLSLAHGKGQVTLLPLDLVQSAADSRPPNHPGVLGLLRDFIGCEERFAPILEALLGGYVLVKDLRTAVRLSKQDEFAVWGLVTPRGEVIERSRAVTGGGPEAGILGRRKRIGKMEQEVALLLAQVTEKRRVREAEAEEISRLTLQVEEFKELVRERVDSKVELDLKLSRIEYEEEGLASTLQQLKRDQKLTAQALEDDQAELEEKRSVLLELEEERVEQEGELDELRVGLSRSEEELDKLSREIDLAQVDLLREEERLRNLLREVETGERRVEEVKSLREKKEREARGVREEIESLSRLLGENEVELKELSQKKERLLKEREESDRRRKEVSLLAKELEEEMQTLREILGSSEEPMQALRMDLLKAEMAEQNLRETISKDYDVDLSALGPKEISREGTAQSIEKLKQSIARLEPVNPLAGEELEEAEERLEFLRSQRFDLVEAKETLRSTLVSIDRKARDQFLDTFGKIKSNFKEIFNRLFGEGEADLLLSSQSTPLEAEIGVVARPPGKRLQRIELLSAGERSLVAIAILFAIYLTRPSPFCILDELDAALDEANLERFITLLRELSEKSQLVLVTHNRRTMEVADYLYGVTMGEPGVTSIVSVKMEHAAQRGDGNEV